MKTRKNKFRFPRRFSRAHCLRKTCKKMGFTEKHRVVRIRTAIRNLVVDEEEAETVSAHQAVNADND